MLEPELQNYLSGINQNLTEIKNKKNPGVWRSFFNGMFSALGYVVGLVIVIIILGFVLKKTGLLANFQEQVKDFQAFMNDARKVMTAGDSAQNSQQQGSVPAGTVITLPNGQKVQVMQ